MGIYLGQLPPAEIARLKAELAETLITNFCYPRFFDYRTESLRMRPIDRTKRQDVWLYLSSVDFTAWGRIDLMSQEFQHQIERLFIQFVQRNRSFFGNQGRKRMPDVRMLISSSALSVSQGLRNHLTGQKTNGIPFGSPRPVASWSQVLSNGQVEAPWEKIVTSTMQLQQQLLDLRGEVPSASAADLPLHSAPTTGVAQRRTAGSSVDAGHIAQQPTVSTVPVTARSSASSPALDPAAVKKMPAASLATTQPAVSVKEALPPRKSEAAPYAAVATPAVSSRPGTSPSVRDSKATPALRSRPESLKPLTDGGASIAHSPAVNPGLDTPVLDKPAATARSLSNTIANSGSSASSLSTSSPAASHDVIAVGEDDVAIFEQLRHQMVVWLRIEAISAGIELSGQNPAQLLDLLRQQVHIDETKLQVVSTLLNLANQVIKTGMVTVLDYKQALMFHLMHTRR